MICGKVCGYQCTPLPSDLTVQFTEPSLLVIAELARSAIGGINKKILP